jgi:hypothetical protein
MVYNRLIELILQIQHFYFLRDCILLYFSSSKRRAGLLMSNLFMKKAFSYFLSPAEK